MPYLAIRKEINNAMNGAITYRERDNRNQNFGQPIAENNIDRIVQAIYKQSNPDVGASFLNTYMLQYSRSEADRATPAAIKPEEPTDIENLKRIRQIQIAKARKHMK